LRKEIHLLILLTSLLAFQIIASFFALNDSLVAYGNPVINPYLWVTPTIYIATELGETFTIDVNISNVDNLHAFEFKLSYNTTLLDTLQVVQGSFFPSPPSVSINKLEVNETAGLVWVNISLSDFETPRSGSGTLAKITFTVTFAPASSLRTYSVLDLHDTILYNDNMESLVHDSVDGLYFWQTLLDDPPEAGSLDLTTQRGGAGLNQTDGIFFLGETVELIAYLTLNGDPVQQKMVAFEVHDPNDEVVLNRVALTDENGYAVVSFKIPSLPESIGTWTATATGLVAERVVWDWLTFVVQAARVPALVGGEMMLVQKSDRTPAFQTDIYLTVLVAIMLLATIINETKRVVRGYFKF